MDSFDPCLCVTDGDCAERLIDRVAARASRLERLVIRLLQYEGERLTMSEAQEYASEILGAIMAAENNVALPDRAAEWRARKHSEFEFLYRVLAGSVGQICQ